MRIMRLDEVKLVTGVSRSTIYEWMNAERFPKSIQLGTRSIGWLASEVEEWLAIAIAKRSQPAGTNPAEVR